MQVFALAGGALCLIGALLDLVGILCESTSNSIFCSPDAKAIGHTGSLFLLAFGSGLLGAGVTQLAANRKTRDLLDEVASALARTVAVPAIYSPEEALMHLRAEFWSYHATQFNGHTVWRVSKYDFRTKPAIGRLFSDIEIRHPNGELDLRYELEAFVRDNTLVTT